MRKYISLLMFLVIIPLSNSGFSQENKVSLIEGVVPEEEEGVVTLSISGKLDETRLKNVTTSLGEATGKELTVTLPASKLRKESFPSLSQSFKTKQVLDSIQIAEKGGRVVITIKTKKEVNALVDPPSGGSPMMVSFAETEPDAPAKAAAEERPAEEEKAKPVATNTDAGGSEAESSEQQSGDDAQQPKQMYQAMSVKYQKPTELRLSILNASGISKRAFKLMSFFRTQKIKRTIEKKLGVKFVLVNVSNAQVFDYSKTIVYYREHYLKSALYLARLMPDNQMITSMKDQDKREGADIEIYLGRDYQ